MSFHTLATDAGRRGKAASPKTLTILLVLCAALTGVVPAFAQAAGGGVKVAVIDVERILLESERGKAALAEIESLRAQKQEEGTTRQKEISDLRQRLADGRLSLSEDKLAELRKQAEDKMIALQRFQDDANRELGKKRDEVLKTIEDSVFPVINELGKEGGYTLVFNKFSSGLVYADEAIDITAKVIERYNQRTAGGQ